MKTENITIDKAESSFCSGWRFKEDCPHNGEFDSDSKYCKDCYNDAMRAMAEIMIDIKGGFNISGDILV